MRTRPKRPKMEHRRPDNLYLSLLVDLGATYQRVFGPEAAIDFMRHHGVPEQIVARVAALNPLRRISTLGPRSASVHPKTGK